MQSHSFALQLRGSQTILVIKTRLSIVYANRGHPTLGFLVGVVGGVLSASHSVKKGILIAMFLKSRIPTILSNKAGRDT
jgi:hypothetical protein